MPPITDVEKSIKKLLLENIRSVKDFPKPGIVFKDITPLVNDKHLLELTSILWADHFRGHRVDHAGGLESRGFLFGTNTAQDLYAAFIPVRKSKKLPAETEQVEYEMEYGTHKDAIKTGVKVPIHDDLNLTGDTALTATGTVQNLDADTIVMKISALNGCSKLEYIAPCYPLLSG